MDLNYDDEPTDADLECKTFDMSRLDGEPVDQLIALSKPIRRGLKRICIKCRVNFQNGVSLKRHMMDAHGTGVIFAELTPEQQEKAIYAKKIYTDIMLTERMTKERLFQEFQHKNGPFCGCIIDGFKNLTEVMKWKVEICHGQMHDHIPLDQCEKCGLVTGGHWVLVHQFFDCDDDKAKRAFAKYPTMHIFKPLFLN